MSKESSKTPVIKEGVRILNGACVKAIDTYKSMVRG